MRYAIAVGLAVVTIAAAIAAAVVLATRDRGSHASTIVSGRTVVEGKAEDAYVALYVSRLPLWALVQAQYDAAGSGIEKIVAEDSSDAEGRFTIRADLDETAAAHLILYATCYRIGCSTPGNCVYKSLPPLRRDDGRWVVRSTGRPLRVTVRIGVDKPDSPCY